MRNDGAELNMSGRVASNPTISGAKGDRISFRAVSTQRRFDDASGEWVDGDEFGVTVVAWRALGTSVLQYVRKGDPVTIMGNMSTRRYEKDGVTEYFTECKADHIGIDIARCTGRMKRDDSESGGYKNAPHDNPANDNLANDNTGNDAAPAAAVDEPARGDSDDPFAVGIDAADGDLPASRPLVDVG